MLCDFCSLFLGLCPLGFDFSVFFGLISLSFLGFLFLCSFGLISMSFGVDSVFWA